MRRYILTVISTFGFLMIWWYFTRDLITQEDQLKYPSPINVLYKGMSQWRPLLDSSLATWYRVLLGMFTGGGIGFLLGLFMSSWKILDEIVDPFIEIIRPIPPIALTPFFILWFGLGDFGQILLIGMGCFMIIVVSTVTAAKNVDPVWILASRSLGANTIQVYLTVIIPSIIPRLISGIRVATATGFALTVAAEYLGAQGGLGFVMRNARVTLETDSVLLCAILLGALSFATDKAIRFVGNIYTDWMPRINNN